MPGPQTTRRVGVIVKALVAALVAADLLVILPDMRYLLAALMTRRSGCPLFTGARSLKEVARFSAARDRVTASTRLVREDGDYRLWTTPMGLFWLPAGSDGLLPFLLAEQEMQIYGDHNLGARPGDVVLDCGAHVGAYTQEALRAGARLVVAIEPAPENPECLRRNLAEEIASGRVVVYAKGVWDQKATLLLQQSRSNSGMDRIATDASAGGVPVELTTIDALVAELGLHGVDFIKMDIEGAERRALAGARATLAAWRPRLAIASYHLPDDHAVIPKIVRQGWPGYRLQCRSCTMRDFGLAPEVLFFH